MVLISACSKDQGVDLDCVDEKLEEFDMVPFTGQEIGCEFFLELYHYRNKQYFVLGSHCADIAINAVDCDGNTLCGTDDNQRKCDRFFRRADNIGIVGISRTEN